MWWGNDMALLTAALQPGATHVVTAPALFYNTAELAPGRVLPSGRGQRLPTRLSLTVLRLSRRTLAYMTLRAFAPRLSATNPAYGGRAPGSLVGRAGPWGHW